MMRRVTVLTIMVMLLALGSIAGAAEGEALVEATEPMCTAVSGTIWALSAPVLDGEALVGFDVVVTEATGPLGGGEVTASLNVTTFLEDGSLEFTGEHRFTDTEMGTFVTADHGITTGQGGVANSLTIVDGGSGFVVTMGHIDLATGELELEYHGIVCTVGME